MPWPIKTGLGQVGCSLGLELELELDTGLDEATDGGADGCGVTVFGLSDSRGQEPQLTVFRKLSAVI